MEMTIDTIIKDCEQGIKQCELFIKAHQKNMEIGEIKEYQYYIERYKLTIDTMRKYQKIEKLYKVYLKDLTTNIYADRKFIKALNEVLEDGSENNHHASNS